MKVRLTPEDDALLRALAGKQDIPPAVLARAFIVRALDAAGDAMATVSPSSIPGGETRHG